MAKHTNSALQKNARRGAVTTWCPECKRKSALGQSLASLTDSFRKCRYCGNIERRKMGERRALYEKWLLDTASLETLRAELRKANTLPGAYHERGKYRQAIAARMGLDAFASDAVLLGDALPETSKSAPRRRKTKK